MVLRLCKLFLPWRKTTARNETAIVSMADVTRNLSDILSEIETDGGTSPRVRNKYRNSLHLQCTAVKISDIKILTSIYSLKSCHYTPQIFKIIVNNIYLHTIPL